MRPCRGGARWARRCRGVSCAMRRRFSGLRNRACACCGGGRRASPRRLARRPTIANSNLAHVLGMLLPRDWLLICAIFVRPRRGANLCPKSSRITAGATSGLRPRRAKDPSPPTPRRAACRRGCWRLPAGARGTARPRRAPALVLARREKVRAPQQVEVGLRVVARNFFDNLLDANHKRSR